MATIYMPLLERGKDAWRQVEVTPLQGAIYRVEGPMPAGEEWEFAPGTMVECKWQKVSDGEHRLIAAGVAPTTLRAGFIEHYKRTAGLLTGILPLLIAQEWVPRTPQGAPEPIPMVLISAGVALVGVIGLIWLRPRSLTGKWAFRSALWFGIFVGLLSVAV